MTVAEVTSVFIVIMLLASIVSYTQFNAYALTPDTIKVGTYGLDDRHSVSYTEGKPDAIWNASAFVMYESNNTIAFDIALNYLSPNPTKSIIYNSTIGKNEELPMNGELKYLDSVFFMQILAIFYHRGLGSASHNPITEIMPIETTMIDYHQSQLGYKGEYSEPSTKVPGELLEVFEIKLSWLRIYEDDGGMLFYEWMVTTCSFIDECPSQTAKLDVWNHSLSGSFRASYPIPENIAEMGGVYGFDYVAWTHQNLELGRDADIGSGDILDDQSENTFVNTIQLLPFGFYVFLITGSVIAAVISVILLVKQRTKDSS